MKRKKTVPIALMLISIILLFSPPVSAGDNYSDSDKDAICSSPSGQGAYVLLTANKYPSYGINNVQGCLI